MRGITKKKHTISHDHNEASFMFLNHLIVSHRLVNISVFKETFSVPSVEN